MKKTNERVRQRKKIREKVR